MKKNTHPKYQDILFVDSSTGTKFVCGAAMEPGQTEVFEGVEYPVYHVPISSASHPLFSGSRQHVDAEGRVDKFMKRYARKNEEEKQGKEEAPEEDSGKSKGKKGKKK